LHDQRRYVIIGNGFAGTTCAEGLRKLDASCSIALFTDEAYPLYNRIALPPMLRKQVTEQKVIMRDQAWHDKHQIDLYLRTRVDKIVPEEKIVIADGVSYPYDALLVATGGRPNASDAPGAEGAHNVYNFQYMDDTKAISQQLETAKSAVSIGGSFIAYELAEAFVSRGVETHWIQRGPRFLRRMLDEISGEYVNEAARKDGAYLHYNEEIAEFVRSNGAVTKVITKSGLTLDTDLVGIGLGLTINTELVAGIGIGIKAGIQCDDRLETSIKGIFAGGDAAEFYDPIAEMHYRMGTWNNAGAHGDQHGRRRRALSRHPRVFIEALHRPDNHAIRALAGVSERSRDGAQLRSRTQTLPRAFLSRRSTRRRTVARQRQPRRQTEVSRRD